MTLPIIIILCLCGVFCFGPLSLYLTWLGAVNRRPRPTVVDGPWDFVALVAGLSGFLIFGGGVLLAGVQSSVRSAFHGNWAQFNAAWEAERLAWLAVALGYLGFVVGFIVLGMVFRARTLAAYNVEREQAEAAVDAALAEVGVPATRMGNLWTHGQGVVAIDAFPGFRHVTLKLLGTDDRLREELERLLRARLSVTFASANPVAVWVSSAALFCLFFSLACVGLLWFIFFLAG